MLDSNTYPDVLPDEKEKRHWYYNDCFDENRLECLRAFTHMDYSIGMHTHSFYELNMILKGNGRHYIENSYLPAQAGNVFVIPPGVRHGYFQSGGLDVFHVLISDQFFLKNTEELKKFDGYSMLFEIEPYLRSRYSESMFLSLSEELLNKITPLLTFLISCEEMEYSGRETMKNAAFLALTGQLCHLMCLQSNVDSYAPHQRYARLLMQSMEYIHTHYGEKITIRQLAQIACMSPSTYIRYFKKFYARAPMEYVIQYRIKQANMLLSGDEKKLSDIAQSCGFYDTSHLIRLLKKYQ